MIFTATDRLTMMEWMVKNAAKLADFIIPKLMFVKQLRHTFTFDNGKEFADYKRIAEEFDAGFYFANAYKSCQRGLNENYNRLIRQYIPKIQTMKPLIIRKLNTNKTNLTTDQEKN